MFEESNKFIKINNKWYCPDHKCYLEKCMNHKTHEIFLKCPANKYFECGTKNAGCFNPNDYEYYTPNLNMSLEEQAIEQIQDDEIDYFNPKGFDWF